jgi:DNA-binding XRE family transcriptional regulator
MGYTPYQILGRKDMAKDFDNLINDIEREAREQGPDAEQEWKDFRAEFRLANQLIDARRKRGLTQRKLAQLSGIDQSEISRIETGSSNPTHATIVALAEPLGYQVGLIPAKQAAARHHARAR